MGECRCSECGWVGDADELVNDFEEDADGDMVGIANACPECGGHTYDLDQ